MADEGVISLRRVGIVTFDLAAAEQFYRGSFGFERVNEAGGDDEQAPAGLIGTAHTRARAVVLRLGSEELELVCYDPPGRAYPAGSAVNDAWFQHIAIVVADIRSAHDLLLRRGETTPISTQGPERLPPDTGAVTVFKFRDPDGHPIELSEFPPNVGAPRWQAPKAGGNCLGIDHSAITIADIGRSLDFYCGVLGLRVTSRSVNRGPEQDRLDGFASDGVDIVALQPRDEDSPHIELLGYHPPGRARPLPRMSDIAATRLTLHVEGLSTVLGRLRSDGALVSRRPIEAATGREAALVRDPDGHLLWLRE